MSTIVVGEAVPTDQGLWRALRRALPFTRDRDVALWRLRNTPNLLRGLWRVVIARVLGIPTHYGCLWLVGYRADGTQVDIGLASFRVVTNAGVAAIVDAFQNIIEAEIFKYHGFGTGTTAEAAGDTALVTELTTQYASDNTRPTGTQTEGAANIYRSVATVTPDTNATLAEHGIFSQAATGGGTLLDRSVFTGVSVGPTGTLLSLEATYDFTVTAGS